MAALFRMPEVAAGTTEALLSEWLVAENTEFSEGDALATVETDKAMVDIEAQTSGIILRYLAEVGERVEVGVGIAVIAEAGESVPDINAAMAELGIGDTTGPTETPATAPTAESVTNATSSVPTTAPQRRFVTPVARRLATERNLDLAAITGTGPHGRIVKRDVVSLLNTPAPPAPAAPQPDAAPAPTADSATLGYIEQPHTRIRKAIAARLTESKNVAPHFYLRGSAKVDALLALRATINEAATTKVSVNDLVVKAAARAHVQIPARHHQEPHEDPAVT
jgi:pyruvate dehydrogenase E2 component (dihydrolipoamide acetyltransferase)